MEDEKNEEKDDNDDDDKEDIPVKNQTIFENDHSNSSFVELDEEYYEDVKALHESHDSCRCLPSCTSIHYDAEISQTYLNLDKYNKKRIKNRYGDDDNEE